MADGRLAVDPHPRLIPASSWPDLFRPPALKANHEDTKVMKRSAAFVPFVPLW